MPVRIEDLLLLTTKEQRTMDDKRTKVRGGSILEVAAPPDFSAAS